MRDEEGLNSLEKIEAILRQPGEAGEKLKKTCRELRRGCSHYDWVGIYLVEGHMLTLKAYDGPLETEHTRIRIGDGICGLAAETGRTAIVGDVSEDPRYIACFPSTRSEIVVPIIEGETVIGEIDIDSDRIDAFSEDDRKFLESIASLIPAVISVDPVPDNED